jgi:hypothetical protein
MSCFERANPTERKAAEYNDEARQSDRRAVALIYESFSMVRVQR